MKKCDFEAMRPMRDVDRGWARVIMVSAFVATVIVYGQFLSSGIYFVMFRNAFAESRSATMWVNSVQAATFSISGLLANFLLVHCGVRTTCMLGCFTLAASYGLNYFSQSIIHVTVFFAFGGAGHSLVTSSIVAATAQYFNKRLYFATGFILSGVGVGMVLMGLEIQWAEATYGWRGAMAIQAGIYLQICIFAALVFKSPPKNDLEFEQLEPKSEKEPEVQSDDDSSSFFADKRFWIQMSSSILFQSCFYLTMQVLKDLIMFNNREFPYEVIIMSMGGSLSVGRLFVGFLASRIGPQLLNTMAIMCFALALPAFVLTNHPWFLTIGAALIGVSIGLQYPSNILIMSVLFGKHYMAIIFGYNSLFLGIPMFVIPLLAGYVVDKTGSYLIVVCSIGMVVALSATLNTVNYYIQRNSRQNDNNDAN